MTSEEIKVDKQLAFIFLTFILLGLTVQSISIHLYEYNQKNSKTKCSNGLIHLIDHAVFKTKVNLTGASTDWGKYIMFEINTSDSLRYTFEANLIYCFDESSTESCYCEHKENDTYYVTCRFEAQKDLSQAKIHGKLSNVNGIHKYSATRRFPIIYDLESMTVYANEQKIIKDKCEITLNAKVRQIHVVCDNAPPPCRLSVSSDGKLLATGENSVHVTEITSDSFTVEYNVCNTNISIICKANYVFREESAKGNDVPSGGTGQACDALILCQLVCFILFRYCRR